MKTYAIPKGALRLEPCTYGLSKVPFRGPRRPTNGQYIACLGSSDTFAKFVPEPFPALVERELGEVCVNLGCQAAGPDMFLTDTAVQSICHDAAATVIEVLGAANLSNDYYRVHPRRNDRFIAPTDKLRQLYPEVDFTDVAFTGHLLSRLERIDPDRFDTVRSHLQRVWVMRMAGLVAASRGPVFLLWFGPNGIGTEDGATGQRPFVTADMIESLRPMVEDIIEVVAPMGDTNGMVFAPLDQLAAQSMMGVDAHRSVAKALRYPLTHALA